MKIETKGAELALVETLNTARLAADSLGNYHARECGGSYGTIRAALIDTLASCIANGQTIYFGDAREIAARICEEIVDNGESVAYNIGLWNDGTIELWGAK